MPKRSKITYYPNLSVKENAIKNGVEEKNILYFIKTHNIDRRRDRKAIIIDKCRAVLKENPSATKADVQRATGISQKTLRRYWGFITAKKYHLSDVNPNKARKQSEYYQKKLSDTPLAEVYSYIDKLTSKEGKEVDRNGYELFSEVLQEIPELFRISDAEDVKKLKKFLFEEAEKPMLFIGSGGANGSFMALLYSMNKGVGVAMTPLQFASLSDKAIQSSRIMLMSKGGKNDDIVYATKRALSVNPENTAGLTFHASDKNRMIKALTKSGAKIFLFNHPEIKDGFTSVRGKYYKYGLVYKAFTGETISPYFENIDLSPEHCFKYQLNEGNEQPVSLEKIEHFVVLYGGFGEPVAIDFESIMAETGVASVQVVDYRNHCHGRFLFSSNHTENEKEPRAYSNVAYVLLYTQREKSLAEQSRKIAIAKKTPIITIESEYDSPLATIDLLIKTNVLIAEICEKGHKVNPYSPQNYSGIDKRFPISGMSFVKSLQDYGELKYKETDLGKRNELKSLIEKFIEQEHKNANEIDRNNSHLPCPKRKDLYKKTPEHYDASKYLCCAFRKTEDFRKGIPIPLGNMSGGFSFKIGETKFPTSEHAYIFGLFSDNNESHIKIQEELLKEPRGYSAKRNIRRRYENDYGRKDWEEFNVEWMLYVVWEKVKNNEAFREILLNIPKEAMIIENSTFQLKPKTGQDKPSYWGCRNSSMEEFEKLVSDYVGTFRGLSDKECERMGNELRFDFCNYGVYIGNNIMGKILTICKKCLEEGSEPDVDYDLLRSKNIHLLGKKINFEKK